MSNKSFTGGRFAFQLGGKTAGFISSVSNGHTIAKLAPHKLGTTFTTRKNIGTIEHQALEIKIAMGMGKEMWEWIKASWDKGFVQQNATLMACDFDHKVQAIREFNNAYIQKVVIPNLKADSQEPGYFTIGIAPESIRYKKGDQSVIQGEENTGAKKWTCANFRFELGDLPCTRVHEIKSFTWEQKNTFDYVGEKREGTLHAGALTVPDLEVTLSMADYWDWYSWFESFVIRGQCNNEHELSGSITFLSHDHEETLATIDLIQVGILELKATDVEANKEEIARFTVKLYVEEMKFSELKN